jgi:hypothetical protein
MQYNSKAKKEECGPDEQAGYGIDGYYVLTGVCRCAFGGKLVLSLLRGAVQLRCGRGRLFSSFSAYEGPRG